MYISISVKNKKLEKNYFLSHFGHNLISACCDICLVLVSWATNVLMSVSHVMLEFNDHSVGDDKIILHNRRESTKDE